MSHIALTAYKTAEKALCAKGFGRVRPTRGIAPARIGG